MAEAARLARTVTLDTPIPPEVVVEVGVAADEDAEVVADRLWTAGVTAVGWRDEGAAVVLVASLPTAAAALVVATEVGGRVVEVDPGWRHAWRAHALPVEVGRQLVVAPAWRPVPVGAGTVVVSIDPGGVFGSGTHPSTRLVLAWLDRDPPLGLSVLDVGCGSGVLSVAAALLGARTVTAVDIDPEAVAVTAANARRNAVGERVRVSATPVAALDVVVDVALVNVTAAVHADLGQWVAARVAEDGAIVVAGLLPGQWRHVADRYPMFSTAEPLALDGWEGAVLRR